MSIETREPTAVYEYHWPTGEPAFRVARYDPVNGHDKKFFRQSSLEAGEWVPRQTIPKGKRPLWRLPDILARPDLPVLIVEGEKTAEAAQAIFGEQLIVTTWAGGSSAVTSADWAPLLERDVTFWPDNDAPGIAAAKALAVILGNAKIVDVPLSFPDAWDLADDLPAGCNYDKIAELIGVAKGEFSEAGLDEMSLLFDPTGWEGQDIPTRKWLVPGLVPYHVPTMLSGIGGLGKTLLGIQLTHAAATGLTWIGCDVQKARALGVLCEDDAEELHRRLNDINIGTGKRFSDLGDLRLMIRDGEESSLMSFPSPYEAGTTTPFFDTLTAQAKAFGAKLIILDSLYNFFNGNENNRVQVSQFIYVLRRMAKECDAAVVFISHPSKAGREGDGYAGSTAWHDAVRSRLFLTEECPENGEKQLLLKTMKANYGPRDGQIEVFYDQGMLHARNAASAAPDPVYRKSACDTVFMDCLREVRADGRNPVDAHNSKNYAPAMFARMGKPGGFKTVDFAAAMERLFGDKRIQVRTEKDRHRNLVKGIFATKDGVKLDDDVNA